MIARRILTAMAAFTVVYRAAGATPPIAGLDEDTREHTLVDGRRTVHGMTVPELLDTDPLDRHFDEAARLLRGETDDDFAALAYGITPEDLAFLRRLERPDH